MAPACSELRIMQPTMEESSAASLMVSRSEVRVSPTTCHLMGWQDGPTPTRRTDWSNQSDGGNGPLAESSVGGEFVPSACKRSRPSENSRNPEKLPVRSSQPLSSDVILSKFYLSCLMWTEEKAVAKDAVTFRFPW